MRLGYLEAGKESLFNLLYFLGKVLNTSPHLTINKNNSESTQVKLQVRNEKCQRK